MLLFGWIFLGAAIGALIGQQRNRMADAALLGALLGPIGWLLILFGPDHRVKCSACLGAVDAAATKCRHCGSNLAVETEFKHIVNCPVCKKETIATDLEMANGMKCPKCGTGWIP
jgi:predicted RNA-binding Zn-ribbon protein involved in translation (DUF1610 family)